MLHLDSYAFQPVSSTVINHYTMQHISIGSKWLSKSGTAFSLSYHSLLREVGPGFDAESLLPL